MELKKKKKQKIRRENNSDYEDACSSKLAERTRGVEKRKNVMGEAGRGVWECEGGDWGGRVFSFFSSERPY